MTQICHTFLLFLYVTLIYNNVENQLGKNKSKAFFSLVEDEHKSCAETFFANHTLTKAVPTRWLDVVRTLNQFDNTG